MKFWRKLLYFLFGMGIGTLAVYFFFGDRDIQCSYFPNDRVLYDLRKKELIYTNEALIKVKQFGLDSIEVSNILLSGDVDFELSDTKTTDTCRTYIIEYRSSKEVQYLTSWMNCDSSAVLISLQELN